MKSFDAMTKEELLTEANIARDAAVCLTALIYKYIGEKITQEQLLKNVSDIMSPQLVEEFKHKYVLNDYMGVCGGKLDCESDFIELGDIEELVLKDDA